MFEEPLDLVVSLSGDEAKKVLEAVLFAAGHAVTYKKLSEVMNIDESDVK